MHGALICLLAVGTTTALTPRATIGVRRASRQVQPTCSAAPPSPLRKALLISGAGSAISWVTTAGYAMCTYKPHRVVHNAIGTSQALTALPVLWSCITVLSDGSTSPDETRRLAVGVAVACIWSAITVIWAPTFTSAVVRTVDPVSYPLAMRIVASSTHFSLAVACTAVWRDAGGTCRILLDRMADAVWGLGPRAEVAEGSSAPAYATLSLTFFTFAAVALAAPFPLATVPSLMGKRCARAFGAWTLLAGVALQTLKTLTEDSCNGAKPGAEPGAEPGASLAAVALRRGLRLMGGAHVLLISARLLLETTAVYPAAIACLPATVASVIVYAIVFAYL